MNSACSTLLSAPLAFPITPMADQQQQETPYDHQVDLRCILPVEVERKGWLRYADYLRKRLHPFVNESNAANVIDYLKPEFFSHRFVPTIQMLPSEPDLDEAIGFSSFGGRQAFIPYDEQWPKCDGYEHEMNVGFQLRVCDTPAVLYAGICPSYVTKDDFLQCFVCLTCYNSLEIQRGIRGICRWTNHANAIRIIMSDQRQPPVSVRDPSEFHLDNSEQFYHYVGQTIYSRSIDSFDIQRYRLTGWIQLDSHPSFESVCALNLIPNEHQRRDWIKYWRQHPESKIIDLANLSGHPKFRNTAYTPNCSQPNCGATMHLLFELPQNSLLPLCWFRDLRVWQCRIHRDEFVVETGD